MERKRERERGKYEIQFLYAVERNKSNLFGFAGGSFVYQMGSGASSDLLARLAGRFLGGRIFLAVFYT